MAMNKYMPRPQKKRGNNGGRNQHIIQDSKQNKTSKLRGQSIGQKFLKSTIYNKKMNPTEITMNLYTYKLNEIPGIMDEIIRCVVIDAPNIKRICFETGYGRPKKSIDIRKCASHFLSNTLGYIPNRGGAPKTFKFLNDHANRIVIFPQDYQDYAKEETERKEKEQAIIDAKNAKKERKAAKKRKKYFVHNKWKKNLKYPEPKKNSHANRVPIAMYDNEGEILDSHLMTPGGDDDDDIVESEDENSLDKDSNSEEEVEETESTFLHNFTNLQVMMQQSQQQNVNDKIPYKRSWNKNKNKNKPPKDVDIFAGVRSNKQKFEYVDPDAWRYKKKPELIYNKANINNSGSRKHMHKKKSKLEGQIDQKGNWICEFCSFENNAHDVICQMCYNESLKKRYEEFMSVVNENNKKNMQCDREKKPNKKMTKWSCEICTFTNENDGDMCEMCGTVNEGREMYLDSMYDDYGSGFFNDAKPKEMERENKYEEEEEKLDMNVRVNYVSGSGNSKKKKNRKVNMKRNKIVLDKNKNKNKDMFCGNSNEISGVNEQIANINREYQAAVWKAHNDKQMRIEMLKRNAKNPNKKVKTKPKAKVKAKVNTGNVKSSKSNSKFIGFIPHAHVSNNNGQKQLNRNRNRNNKLNIKKQQKHTGVKRENVSSVTSVRMNAKNKKINVMNSKQTRKSYAKINFEWVDKLVKMGFQYDKAFDAVSDTNSVGFNEALDYLMQNV